MPFTFTPEVAQPNNGQSQAPAAPSAFGNAQPAMNLMQRATEADGRSWLEIILIAIFALTLLVAVAMFGYEYYLSSQVEQKKAALASYESQLGNLPLDDMRNLSNRIKIISRLVKQHPSANVAFKIVEDSVENPVTYTQFDLHYVDAAASYDLTLSGVSPDYKSVAQQIDTFTRKPYSNYLQNLKLDTLSLDEKGVVHFGLKSSIAIIGLLPEDLNLSDGVAALVASSTPEGEATSTPQTGSSTPQQ